MSSHPSGAFFRRPNFGICLRIIILLLMLSPLVHRSLRLPIRPGAASCLLQCRREYSTEDSQTKTPSRLSRLFTLSRPIESLILRSRLTHDLDLARFLAKAGSISIYSIFGVTVLGTLGVDTNPIIAGIGVTGFTVGFALKEIATNFLSGVLLVFNKPFRKGQYLKVMGTAAGLHMEGVVESIDARYVLLRKDTGLLMIPSVMVYTNPILVTDIDVKIESNKA